MRIGEIMTTGVVTVRRETAIKEVASLLVERRINAVPVVEQDQRLVGIVSEGDLIRLERGPDPLQHAIPGRYRHEPMPAIAGDVMSHKVIALQEEADVGEAARLMVERRIKQIPVVRDGRVVGIVARRDLLRVLARSDDEIQRELEELLEEEAEALGRFRADVSGGVAILRGPGERGRRRLAESIARSVPGVASVRFEEQP
jgi:CBS domain-containing protein